MAFKIKEIRAQFKAGMDGMLKKGNLMTKPTVMTMRKCCV
jgi:hypothetical protein